MRLLRLDDTKQLFEFALSSDYEEVRLLFCQYFATVLDKKLIS